MKWIVFLASAALLLGFSAPAFCSEEAPKGGVESFYGDTTYKLYGRASTHVWRLQEEGEVIGSEHDDSDTYFHLGAGTKVGAFIERGNLVGRFEYGAKKESNLEEVADIRIAYGGWKSGGHQVWFGKYYTPTAFYYSRQVYGVIKFPGLRDPIIITDLDMCGFGGLYSREPLIQYQFNTKGHELRLAIIEPNAKLSQIKNSGDFVETDVDLPRFEFRYTSSSKHHQIKLGGGYQTFKAVTAEDKDYTINSWVLALGGYYKIAGLQLGAMVSGGKNINTFGQFWYPTSYASYDAGDDEIKDNTGIAYTFNARYTINDKFAVEAGYGHSESEDDVDGAETDDAQTYYLQAPITLARGMSVTPEIGVLDHMDGSAGQDQGKATYAGMKFMIDF